MDPRQMQNYGPPMTPPGYPGGQMGSNSFSQSNQYPSISQAGNPSANAMPGGMDGKIPFTPGRFVGSEDEIVAREVPMDGCPAVFPQRDLSCVYLKQWNNRGTIDTVRYILDKKPEVTATNNSSYGEILNRLDRLEELLTAQPKAATSRSKAKNRTEEEAE